MNHEVSYTDIRRNLKSCLDKVCMEHIPLRVTRKNGDNVVVISEEDYRSLEETAYLSRSPKNLQRLIAALSRKNGKSLDEVRHELGI
jgi:antitoxin YefM